MIHLNGRHDAEIRTHGTRSYPFECCGFLLGQELEGIKVVTEVRPTVNGREDSPENRFLIEPSEFVKVQRESAMAGLDILGFYHSHPDVAARPSQFDRDHAWPWYSYLILSVRDGIPKELYSWIVLAETEPFSSEPLEVTSEATP